MSFLDDLLGNTAADASRKAAADTYAKQQAATQGITQAGQDYATHFSDLAKGYQPWMTTGATANDAVGRLMADPSSVSSLPGYQFDLAQGTRALDHSAVANGNLFSGKQGKALVSYGTNLADKTFGDQLSRLLGVSNQGLNATQAGINTTGTGLTGQLGANTSAYNGNMTSAGTIGQGDIAAANAKAKGTQGIVNLLGSVAGSALGGPLGGMMGGSLGSLFGGGSSGAGYGNFGQYSPYSPMNAG